MAALSPLEAQLRECFGRVAYSHKAHEKCADICRAKLNRLKVVQIVLSAITTGGIVTTILSSHEVEFIAKVVSVILSTALLILNAYSKDIDPGQQSEKHKETATALWNIRESYLALITDLRQGSLNLDGIRAKRDELQASLAKIYQLAPRTTGKAYRDAQAGLQQNEELTFSDAELDQLLPPALRIIRHETSPTDAM